MKRLEIEGLLKFGPFPSEQQANPEVIDQQEKLVKQIQLPILDEEAKALLTLFGPDDYFGLAWTILHLIESAPHWPLQDCLAGTSNEWIERLKQRAKKAHKVQI